jgi:hypothetical protein
MASPLAQGTTIMESRCPHCDSSMLVHDGTIAEITCQLCARVWECDPTTPGHEDCTHYSYLRHFPIFPSGAASSIHSMV